MNGRGWAGRTSPTRRRRTGLKGRLHRPTFLGDEPVGRVLLLGPVPPKISGSLVGKASTQRGQEPSSTTCGSTARANGRGWVGRTLPARRGRTELRGRLPLAMFPGRGSILRFGPMPPETYGSSVGKGMIRRR